MKIEGVVTAMISEYPLKSHPGDGKACKVMYYALLKPTRQN